MSSRLNPLLVGAIKYLGAQINDVEPLFGKMACMRNVERQQYAELEILKIWFPDAPKLHALINKVQRTTQILGLALWPRTELTDLSAKAQTSPYRQKRDVKEQIDELPENLNEYINQIVKGEFPSIERETTETLETLLHSKDE